MQNNGAIQTLVVVGGGSAGWMTAAMLSSQLNGIHIQLVESDQIGTIGVGEATIPPIKRFNAMLGLDEHEFLRRCNGSIKLGIQFENWLQPGHSYFHQFGRFGADFDYIPFPYFYYQAKTQGYPHSIQQFSAAWQLASRNKFAPPNPDPRHLFSGFDYAYHFDASLYAAFLRQYAEQRGVERIEGRIAAVNRTSSGAIADLVLESGQVVSGQFFVDCTGLQALLLGKTLGVDFIDWSEYLFNDSAVAVQSLLAGPVRPYTRSIAHQAGWQWRIPLQTRMGNGNVFSSRYMTAQAATDLLVSSVEGPLKTDPRLIRFQTGRRRAFWQHNCVAIGLSAGFLEPLESTSLHLIQRGIMRLLSLFPSAVPNEADIAEYNAQTVAEYEHIRDFIVLHYHATQRRDSPYWQDCASMALPESLQQRLQLFCQHGHLRIEDKELFKQESWWAVLLGQGIEPQQAAPVTRHKQHLDLRRTLDAMLSAYQDGALSASGHEQYLMKHCAYSPL
ncbi:tryptophan halogenase family protein [Rheinheimera sp.]|uniref:tryptophan halogenase family protein n=1 Tax=Rheinheimera sp. TaxID=1869214 RepID=UPI00307D9C66